MNEDTEVLFIKGVIRKVNDDKWNFTPEGATGNHWFFTDAQLAKLFPDDLPKDGDSVMFQGHTEHQPLTQYPIHGIKGINQYKDYWVFTDDETGGASD